MKLKGNKIPSQLSTLKAPIITLSILGLLTATNFTLFQKSTFAYSYPKINAQIKTLQTMQTNLNTAQANAQSYSNNISAYQQVIDKYSNKMNAMHLSRTQTTDLESLIRYLDFKSYDFNLNLNKTDIKYKGTQPYLVCSITGTYENLQKFFTKLNTLEIFYIKDFKAVNINEGVKVDFTIFFDANTANTVLAEIDKDTNEDTDSINGENKGKATDTPKALVPKTPNPEPYKPTAEDAQQANVDNKTKANNGQQPSQQSAPQSSEEDSNAMSELNGLNN